MPTLEENFRVVLNDHTAGDPMRPEVKWTNLTPGEISQRLEALGTPAGRDVVKQLLRAHGYRKRKMRKRTTMGPRHPQRNAQFENIARLREEYLRCGDPVISMDGKKKELLGNFYRDGQLYTREAIDVFDHDFATAGEGKVLPHGLYDVGKNTGHINLGTSHETSEFACESLEHWWLTRGRAEYPAARRMLLLCDGGGSNSANRYVFKEELQRLADRLGLEIRVAHYPPYCSKYNVIEHRMFPHVTRACQGMVFWTAEVVKGLMERTRTSTGLRVTVDIMDKVYALGKSCSKGFKKTMKIAFDALMPKWNYRALPGATLHATA